MTIRPRRRIDDLFFIYGDRLSFQSSDNIAISYVEEKYFDDHDEPITTTSSTTNTSQPREEAIDEIEQKEYTDPEKSILCSATHCYETFDSIAESQYHYENKHVFECHECFKQNKKIFVCFPNEHLLDLHLQEKHDSYFQSALEHKREGACYKCLVMDCNSVFAGEKDRFLHLKNFHGYPNWFRFHSRQQLKKQVQLSKNYKKQQNKSMQSWYNKRSKYSKESMHTGDDNHNGVDETKSNEQQQTKKKRIIKDRKEKKKICNATIPCRFYNSKGGCWRGDNCMFLHKYVKNTYKNSDTLSSDYIETPNTAMNYKEQNVMIAHQDRSEVDTAMDIEEEIDNIIQKVKTDVKISVPQKISFGRRRR